MPDLTKNSAPKKIRIPGLTKSTASLAYRRQRSLVRSPKSGMLEGCQHMSDMKNRMVRRMPEQRRFLAFPNASVAMGFVYLLLSCHFPNGAEKLAQLGTSRVENFE